VSAEGASFARGKDSQSIGSRAFDALECAVATKGKIIKENLFVPISPSSTPDPGRRRDIGGRQMMGETLRPYFPFPP
jgi:hypothetical protein